MNVLLNSKAKQLVVNASFRGKYLVTMIPSRSKNTFNTYMITMTIIVIDAREKNP